MKKNFYSLLLCALLGITGMQAWAQELSTTEIEGVEYYQIGSAEDLEAFAALVCDEGQSGANAILTADIALTQPWETPIGITGAAYTGIFDGQGHQISGFDATAEADAWGLFGLTANATIRNFSISGKLTANGGTGSGVIGYPSNSTIFNVHSALEINVPLPSVHHVGGVVGSARGGNTISSCTFSGSMTGEDGSTDNFAGIVAYLGGDSVAYCTNYGNITFYAAGCAAGGIAGYLNNTGSYVKGCLNMGKVTCSDTEATPTYGGAIVGRLRTYDTAKLTGNCWLEGSGYAGAHNDTGTEALAAALCFTSDKLATGEVCYALNGDQTQIGWYQTLGTDEVPVLDATHARVYMNGRLHCNGDVYEGSAYSNEDTGVTQDDHNIVDGFCDYCNLFDETYLTPNADGYYELANAKLLAWFEQKVNKGEFNAKGILTADIDFAELGENAAWTPIGDWGATRGVSSAGYCGHFDGQGHTLKNFNFTGTQNYYGVFGVLTAGALVENFTIYGEVTCSFKTMGVVGYTRDTSTTVRGIHSYMNIHNVTVGNRFGGIVGSAVNGTTNIENCTYSGTLDGYDNAGNGNYGGIVGYVNNNAAAIVNITNCLFDGEVINTVSSPGGCTFGGFVGYSNGGIVTIKNSLSIGTVQSAIYGQFFGAVKSAKSSLPNCYYVGEFVNGSASSVDIPATQTNAFELGTGEIAWKLNEETFLDAPWHQTLGENAYPVLDASQAVVYKDVSGGYDCISKDDSDSFSSFLQTVITNEREFIEDPDLVAYQPLVEAYKQAIESWEEISNYDDFLAAYKEASALKDGILKSAAAYASYVQACEATAAYMKENGLEGTWSDFLKAYLEETIEPNTDYPNGSFAYIMENLNLDDEALAEEIAFVNQMLENALAGGVTSGTEVTRLLANPSFADNLEGWTTQEDGASVATGGVAEVMKVARGKGSGQFSISQTRKELPNGICLMKANGIVLAGQDIYSQYYAGQLYLNGTSNYFMSPGEDMLATDEAEDKVNCDLASDSQYEKDGETGYVPSTFTGCSYAFHAGRYENFCATEVTDGNLTVGVRNLGTDLSSDDWLPFGGVRLYYLGTAEEASTELSEALEGYKARAQVIVDFTYSEDPADFMQYPNISSDLKDRLTAAIAAADAASTGEEKMTAIGEFSRLFGEVYACRKAYIAMYDAANKLYDMLDALYYDLGLISEMEYNDYASLIDQTQDHFMNGDISTEEALAIAERLSVLDEMMPQVDGVYQLGSVAQLKLFAMNVNNGESDAKAVLTNDIDMGEVEYYQPIGTKEKPFKGVFDGQGFKITNFGQYVQESEESGYYTLSMSGDGQGFIGWASGATIQNFSIDGAIEYTGGTGVGTIGWATGSKLINIHSTLDIAVVATSHHIGGICGHLSENSSATNCSFGGSITDTAGNNDCIGGIGAYSNNGVSYTNCANYGDIIYTNSAAYAGGICGYVNNDSFTGIFNCLNTGRVAMADGSMPSGAIVGRLRGHANSKFENNYVLEGSAAKAANNNDGVETLPSTPFVSADQLASGEICFKLNGDQSAVNWYQTLQEDVYPVLDPTHKVVYDAGDGTYTNEKVSKPDGSKENPFVVKSAADLAGLINQLVSGRMNYVVMEADVDMTGVTDWTPLFNIPDQSNGYPFIDFDGKNHVIRNLTSNTTGAYDYCGLFGILCGNVRNLGVENADVTCAGGTGILAGYLGHASYGQPCYVENVWVTGKLTASGYCGSLFGNVADEAHILNCYANVEVTGSSDLTGGIIGRVRNRVEMTQVYAAGSINRGGGIIGGGQQAATPLGAYKHVAVWNNTEKNFGPVREGEEPIMALYYDGTNFAEMQSQVVAWDPAVWTCDMQPESYPVLKAFAGLSGDLNGDGKTDIADAVTVLNIMAASEYQAAADLNGDGKVDIADFVTILNLMAQQ